MLNLFKLSRHARNVTIQNVNLRNICKVCTALATDLPVSFIKFVRIQLTHSFRLAELWVARNVCIFQKFVHGNGIIYINNKNCHAFMLLKHFSWRIILQNACKCYRKLWAIRIWCNVCVYSACFTVAYIRNICNISAYLMQFRSFVE